jgi:Na+-transporting methylmalonyl-CoA/oxaloacetate decarboxylase gamma subunit
MRKLNIMRPVIYLNQVKKWFDRFIYFLGFIFLFLLISIVTISLMNKVIEYAILPSWEPRYNTGECLVLKSEEGSVLVKVDVVNNPKGFYKISVLEMSPEVEGPRLINLEIEGDLLDQEGDPLDCQTHQPMTI